MNNQITSTNKATDIVKRDLLKFRAFMEPGDNTFLHHRMVAVVDTVANLFNSVSCTFFCRDAETCKDFANKYPGARIATLLVDQREVPGDFIGYDEEADYLIIGPTFFAIPDDDRLEDLSEEIEEITLLRIESLDDDQIISTLNLEDPDWWHAQGWYIAEDE